MTHTPSFLASSTSCGFFVHPGQWGWDSAFGKRRVLVASLCLYKIWCLVPFKEETENTGNYLSAELRSEGRSIKKMERNNLMIPYNLEWHRNLLWPLINSNWHLVGIQETFADQWMKKWCKNNAELGYLDILTSCKTYFLEGSSSFFFSILDFYFL